MFQGALVNTRIRAVFALRRQGILAVGTNKSPGIQTCQRRATTAAAVCEVLGEPLLYRQWELGLVPPGHVRIKVAATGVNFAELLQVRGKYQEKRDPPFVPGNECAGEVSELGAGCEESGLQLGDRVICLARGGGYAGETLVPWSECVPLGRSPAAKAAELSEAAALLLAYGTAHLALNRRAQARAGETVLVTAAAGGVGLACVELAQIMGLRALAACGSEAKLAIARSKGAEGAGVCYGPGAADFREQVRAAAGAEGIDIVVDMVGSHLGEAVRCLNWEGRAVVVGFTGGNIPKVPANILLVKNVSVSGVFFGGYKQRAPSVLQDSAQQLVKWWLAGDLKPRVGATLPLSRANEALALLENRQSSGKVVLLPDT